MKNILKQIKQIFVDNKEYFIRCTIMTLIAGLVLGISISLVVPVSAAEESSEGDQTLIPAGTYRWNESLTIPEANGAEYFPIFEVEDFVFITSANFNGQTIDYRCKKVGIALHANGDAPDFHYYGEAYVDLFNPGTFEWTALNVDPYSYANDSWVASVFGYTVNYSREFTVIRDVEVSIDAFTWFFANTTNSGDVDPDPEYTVPAGWYLWQEELLGEFIPHTLSFNYRTFQRVGDSGIPFYSYWSRMQFDNFVEDDSYFSRLYYSSVSNGQVLVYDDINGGWIDETYRRFYISSPLTLSSEDYFIFNAYTEYYGDTPPSFPGETVPSVPDPDSNIFTNIIGGVLDALDAFTIFGGFSLLDLLTTLLGGMALVWILKLLAGG